MNSTPASVAAAPALDHFEQTARQAFDNPGLRREVIERIADVPEQAIRGIDPARKPQLVATALTMLGHEAAENPEAARDPVFTRALMKVRNVSEGVTLEGRSALHDAEIGGALANELHDMPAAKRHAMVHFYRSQEFYDLSVHLPEEMTMVSARETAAPAWLVEQIIRTGFVTAAAPRETAKYHALAHGAGDLETRPTAEGCGFADALVLLAHAPERETKGQQLRRDQALRIVTASAKALGEEAFRAIASEVERRIETRPALSFDTEKNREALVEAGVLAPRKSFLHKDFALTKLHGKVPENRFYDLPHGVFI